MMDIIHSAGLFGVLLVALGILALPLSVVTIVLAFVPKEKGTARGLAIGALIAGGIALLMGGLGYAFGLAQVERALAFASPEHVEQMRAVGQAEALNCIKLAVGVAAAPLIAGVVALIKASGPSKQ